MEQHELDRTKRAQLGKAPEYDFGELLKDLTPHQHAVLIDLGMFLLKSYMYILPIT